MKNKILLISPTTASGVRMPKGIRIPEIALGIISALTPNDFEVEIIEEELTQIDYDKECEIVGISCMTSNANRSYEIADEFKRRGKTVVLGGIHPTVLPDEALRHCDSVVIGEAEGSWGNLLEDYKNNKLKQKYNSNHPELSDYPCPKREKEKGIRIFNVKPVLTTKGCPYNCSFCSVHNVFGNKIRHIPVEKVIEDIVLSEGTNFLFVDDNIMGYPTYAKKLFKELIPLKIKWVGQSSISFVKDEELMKLAYKSGCKGLFFGLESVSKNQLKKFRKNFKDISEIENAIQKIEDFGILFHASLVFGFDDDPESIFDDTLEFLMKNKIMATSINILTPYPGTQLYDQFKKEGRLLTEDWQYYDTNNVVYMPKNISPRSLTENVFRVRQEYYSYGSILKRFSGSLNHPLLYLMTNLAYHSLSKRSFVTWKDKINAIIEAYKNGNKLKTIYS